MCFFGLRKHQSIQMLKQTAFENALKHTFKQPKHTKVANNYSFPLNNGLLKSLNKKTT